MKLNPFARHQDVQPLKWPTLSLVIGALIGTICCIFALHFREQSRKTLKMAQSQRMAKQTLIRELEEEQRTIRTYSGRYRSLENDGIIGEEDRLALMETVAWIRSQHHLFPVQIDIGQQAALPIDQTGPITGSDKEVELRASRIRLHMPLLHEEDLSHLLDGLPQIKRGLFITEECSIKRSGEEAGNPLQQVRNNLDAACTILWLTISERKRDEEPGRMMPK